MQIRRQFNNDARHLELPRVVGFQLKLIQSPARATKDGTASNQAGQGQQLEAEQDNHECVGANAQTFD